MRASRIREICCVTLIGCLALPALPAIADGASTRTAFDLRLEEALAYQPPTFGFTAGLDGEGLGMYSEPESEASPVQQIEITKLDPEALEQASWQNSQVDGRLGRRPESPLPIRALGEEALVRRGRRRGGGRSRGRRRWRRRRRRRLLIGRRPLLGRRHGPSDGPRGAPIPGPFDTAPEIAAPTRRITGSRDSSLDSRDEHERELDENH